MSVNQISIEGHLTRDAEEKSYQDKNGVSQIFLTMTIANNFAKDKTLFIDAVQFGYIAGRLRGRLRKGTHVVGSGRLEQDFWTDRDGNNRSTFKIVLESLAMIPREAQNQQGAQQNASNGQSYPQQQNNAPQASYANNSQGFQPTTSQERPPYPGTQNPEFTNQGAQGVSPADDDDIPF